MAQLLRPVFLGLRAAAVVVFVLSIAVAWLLMDDDQAGRAVWALVAGSAFLIATLLNPLSRAFRVALVVSLVAMLGLGGFTNPITLVVIAVLIVAIFLVLRRRIVIQIDPDSVRALPATEVMAGAAGFVGQFKNLGWTQIGAVGFDLMGHTIVESVLVAPQLDRYALVTDVVVTVTSQIDDVRFLVTRNSGISDIGPSILTNDLEGASPPELVHGHEAALEAIAPYGAAAVPLLAEDVVATVVREEQASLRAGVRRRGRGDPRGPIDGSAMAERRIRDWLGMPTAD